MMDINHVSGISGLGDQYSSKGNAKGSDDEFSKLLGEFSATIDDSLDTERSHQVNLGAAVEDKLQDDNNPFAAVDAIQNQLLGHLSPEAKARFTDHGGFSVPLTDSSQFGTP